MKKFFSFFNALGPSILWASAAIGVSHIVQSTRAGANFGYLMIIVVLLANFLKYPFFEFSTRYTVVKNETVLDGYKKIGNWAIYLFSALTILTMFTIQAGVTRVTAAIMKNGLSLDFNHIICSILILILCSLIILFIRRNFFDSFVKALVMILIISTLISLFLTFDINNKVENFVEPQLLSYLGISFLIALIGWMPSPLDLSAWSSIWIIDKRKSGSEVSLKDNSFDFNFSYIWTSILACAFVILGANVFYGSGVDFASSSSKFVNQLVKLYGSLGSWAESIILITAFSTMFSTTLTCLDAFPKVLKKCFELILPNFKKSEFFYMTFVIFGTILTLLFLGQQMRFLIDLATILSFLTAPFIAVLNFKLIYNKDFPNKYLPSSFFKYLAISGIFFLIVFSIIFICNVFGLFF
tara:strand:+ start:34968 stop:36200 length:1233 start_codon:yes stop_codon:yes gene_type:complete